MSDLVRSGLIVGVLAMLLFTPFLMSRGVSRLDGRSGPVDTILCLLPFINTARAEKIYFGRVRLMTISQITLVVCVVARVLIWGYAYDNVMIGTISIVLFWAAILFYFISNMVFVYTVIHDADVMSGFKLLLFTVAYPFGQYYIGSYLSNVVRHMKDKEATFRG